MLLGRLYVDQHPDDDLVLLQIFEGIPTSEPPTFDGTDVLEIAPDYPRTLFLCGEMSGDLTYTMLLLGMGLKEFSVAPSAIPEVKKIIRSIEMDQAREVAERAMEFQEAEKAVAFLHEQTQRVMPQAF